MDVYIQTNIQQCKSLFREAGFRIIERSGYADAELKTSFGRFHIHFAALPTQVYADLHYDLRVHFLFLGVFYQRFTEGFLKQVLLPVLVKHKIGYSWSKSSWLRRRNRAILWGMRI